MIKVTGYLEKPAEEKKKYKFVIKKKQTDIDTKEKQTSNIQNQQSKEKQPDMSLQKTDNKRNIIWSEEEKCVIIWLWNLQGT